MDVAARRVTVAGADVALPPAECELLRLLLRERGRCVTRRQFAVALAAAGAPADHLDTYIAALRAALACVEVVNVGGAGYRIVLTPSVPRAVRARAGRSRRVSA